MEFEALFFAGARFSMELEEQSAAESFFEDNMSQTKEILLILGDQLSEELLEPFDPESCSVVMIESWDECSYVSHHRKKIIFFLSAMRHFAKNIQDKGFDLHYLRLEKDECSLANKFLQQGMKLQAAHYHYYHPGEWRLIEDLQSVLSDVESTCHEDPRFFCSPSQFKDWIEKRKRVLMEDFYRWQRIQHQILVDSNNKPVGGQWNYDQQNRKSLPKSVVLPNPLSFKPDEITQSVVEEVGEYFPEGFGEVSNFDWAVTSEQSWELFEYFLETSLSQFGDYQDAMTQRSPFLFHSLLSAQINAGLLDVRRVVDRVARFAREESVPLNSAEGFIRQIMGWREFIRGIYWLRMPEYKSLNHFDSKRSLPEFYWSGNTRMNCVSKTVNQIIEHSYAHHIQRLMVTGNFALLAGLDVQEVCDWYLAVFRDAIEWVELPNTLGMSLFADGGFFASKPYCASGAYISRMSDYCKDCHYDPKDNTGERTCPFTALYWHFLERNRDKLEQNMRMKFPYKNLNQMDQTRKEHLLGRAEEILKDLSQV